MPANSGGRRPAAGIRPTPRQLPAARPPRRTTSQGCSSSRFSSSCPTTPRNAGAASRRACRAASRTRGRAAAAHDRSDPRSRAPGRRPAGSAAYAPCAQPGSDHAGPHSTSPAGQSARPPRRPAPATAHPHSSSPSRRQAPPSPGAVLPLQIRAVQRYTVSGSGPPAVEIQPVLAQHALPNPRPERLSIGEISRLDLVPLAERGPVPNSSR
jgi:hypothetical protein